MNKTSLIVIGVIVFLGGSSFLLVQISSQSAKQTVEQQTTLPTTKHEVTKQQTLPSDKQTIKQQYSQVCTPPAKLCIISPKNGTVVVPGETVSVVINLASGVTYPNGVTVAGGGTAAGSILTASPFHFNYTVPNDAPVGKLHLTAMGSSKPQQVEFSAPITLYVERPDTPTVLSVVPFHIQFSAPGDQQRLDIEGTFPNGNVLPLNHSSLTTISSTNPTVAYVDNRGFVTAMSAGNATIIIKYRDKEVNVRVNVPHTIPGDLNGDGIVDQEDINLVLAALGYSADKPFDARDINNDGVISMLDVKKLTLLCTYSHCASQ